MDDIPWTRLIPKFGKQEAVDPWLATQLGRCHDQEFAESFCQGCPVEGAAPQEYGHRILEVDGEYLLAGIRFKGGDIRMPFVELMAWTGTLQDSIRDEIRLAYELFSPKWLRVRLPVEETPPWRADVDQHLVAGPADGQWSPQIEVAHDTSWYGNFPAAFRRWQTASPIGTEVSPADRNDFEICLKSGHVVIATEGRDWQGVAACRWEAERAFDGWCMIEEFVAPEAQGRGLGVSLQRGLMTRASPGDLFWGTIHGNNEPSLRTALRCGREIVETWWFVPLND